MYSCSWGRPSAGVCLTCQGVTYSFWPAISVILHFLPLITQWILFLFCLFVCLFVWDRISLYSSDWPQTHKRSEVVVKGKHLYGRRCGGFLFSHFFCDFVLDILNLTETCLHVNILVLVGVRGLWNSCICGLVSCHSFWKILGHYYFKYLFVFSSHIPHMWLLFSFPHSSEFCSLSFLPLAFQFGNFLLMYLEQAWLFFAGLYPLRYSWFLFLFLFLALPFETSHHLLSPTCFCMLPTFSTAINISIILILCFQMFPKSMSCVVLLGCFLSPCFIFSCLICFVEIRTWDIGVMTQ